MAKKTPAYRKETGRDLAAVTMRDADTGKRRHFYLGKYDSPGSYERYCSLLTMWEANSRRPPQQHQAQGTERPAKARRWPANGRSSPRPGLRIEKPHWTAKREPG
jgi:hypothetical protein